MMLRISTFFHDWASWDDTYNFVQNANPNYIQTNLVDETFINSKLNLMLFFNAAGNFVRQSLRSAHNDRGTYT
ncbi:hypothetical protein KEJ33_03655 [Candidatus Bathyarchaeota archaeon]|nr:hypothetical protein [Candidatus Bathyarchaeota archaeon]